MCRSELTRAAIDLSCLCSTYLVERAERSRCFTQRAIRDYLACRQARLKALVYMWKDVLRRVGRPQSWIWSDACFRAETELLHGLQKYNQAVAREEQEENERFKKAMEVRESYAMYAATSCT